jgi:hypothetical protein
MPSWFSLLISVARSSALTSAPRTATPVTAPISRLVFVADAAMLSVWPARRPGPRT